MKKTKLPFNSSYLVLKAQKGDQAAFEELVKHYEPIVFRLITRHIGNKSESADLTQEVFIKIFNSIKRFRRESQFYTWLYRITMNTITNYIHYKQCHTPCSDLSLDDHELALYWLKHAPKQLIEPDSSSLDDEAGNILLESVRALPQEYQKALLMRDLRGLSYTKIAQIMNSPIGTVRTRIFRARNQVFAALTEYK